MKKKIFASTVAVALGALLLAGCASAGGNGWYPAGTGGLDFAMGDASSPNGNFQYGSVVEQGYHAVSEANASYFSLDRNTASYSQMRAQIENGARVSADSVRTEELYNYFSYDYPAPAAGEGLKATAYLSSCPWNAEHSLVTVGVKSEERVLQSSRNNYVFLVDVSGSMSANVWGTDYTCLGLAQYGMKTMLEGLNERDAVSIVTYASGIKTVLEPTLADGKGKAQIEKKINALAASGATNGEGGLQLAYEQANRYYAKDGNNRVILMTDGDFNVGMSSEAQLKEFISQKAESGVYLSVLGFGLGNMRDDLMQTLALNGNGNYAYIDTPREAKKVLSQELNGMLVAVAKDAKASVTFREDAVEEYRIIGYDMKILSEEDFENAEKDAGEIGSNLCVTAVYEVALKEGVAQGADIAEVAVRFKTADTGENREIKAAVKNEANGTSDTEFVACVAEFGLVIRNSQYKANASLANVVARLEEMKPYLAADENKTEFLSLVKKANTQEYGA